MTTTQPPPPTGRVTEVEALRALPRAVVVTDADGTILLWNTEAEELYGWRRGRGPRPVRPRGAGARRRARRQPQGARPPPLRRRAARRPHRAPGATARDPGGHDRPGRSSTAPGASSPSSARPRTSPTRRSTEQAHASLADHFRLALDAGGLGTWRWDIATGSTIGTSAWRRCSASRPAASTAPSRPTWRCCTPTTATRCWQVRTSGRASAARTASSTGSVWPDGSVHWITGAGGVTLDDGRRSPAPSAAAPTSPTGPPRAGARAARGRGADDGRARAGAPRSASSSSTAINDALGDLARPPELMRNVTRAAVPRLGDWCAIHLLPAIRRRPAPTPEVEIAHVDPAMVGLRPRAAGAVPYDPDAPTGMPHVIRTGEPEFYPDHHADVLDAARHRRRGAAQVVERPGAAQRRSPSRSSSGAASSAPCSSSWPSSARRYTDDDLALAQAVAGRIAVEPREPPPRRRSSATSPTPCSAACCPRRSPTSRARHRRALLGRRRGHRGRRRLLRRVRDRRRDRGRSSSATCAAPARPPRPSPGWPATRIRARRLARRRPGGGPARAEPRHAARPTRARSAPRPSAMLHRSGRLRRSTVAVRRAPARRARRRRRDARTVGEPGHPDRRLRRVTRPPRRPSHLEPGDIVVLYTDGATDVPRPHRLTATELRDLVGDAVAAGERPTPRPSPTAPRASWHGILPLDQRSDDIALLVLAIDR